MNILKQLKPKQSEIKAATKQIDKFLKTLNKGIKGAEAICGGSFIKNTWLSGNYDVDIFVRFDYTKYKGKDISKVLEGILSKKFKKIDLIHGSRDYFQLKQGKIVFEIIPVLKIQKSKQAVNVTDVSPLHAEWVIANSDEKLQDEIRITKQFLKANDLYGAESYIRGFSGYCTEVLVISYGGFKKLLKAITKWGDKQIIDPYGYYNNVTDVMKRLNTSKTYSPLILVDPVQKDRNIAAALGFEKYDKLKELAKQYLKKPSSKFFEKKEISLSKLKNQGCALVEVEPLDTKRDIAGAKLVKAFGFIRQRLLGEGFKLKDSGWKWDNKKAYFWFKMEGKISKFRQHYGPNTSHKIDLQRFMVKWSGYKHYKEKGRIYVKIKRPYGNIKDYLKDLIREDTIVSKVDKIKVM